MTLRQLVFRALANAEENGYILDDDDTQEAIDLMDTDSDVEAFCLQEYSEGLDEVEAVAALVAEWRAGART